MRFISEDSVRQLYKKNKFTEYLIPEGYILAQGAKDFLTNNKVKVLKKSNENKSICNKNKDVVSLKKGFSISTTSSKYKYVDAYSGEGYDEKPEFMTQMAGNKIVLKSDPRIIFRGKMDSLNALIVLTQSEILMHNQNSKLIKPLSEILDFLAHMTRCEILEEPFTKTELLGFSPEQLRDMSHHPLKYFNVEQMIMPHYSLGFEYAKLNYIRTQIRKTEISAIKAFTDVNDQNNLNILRALNRLSSCVHILMCMYLRGDFK